MITVIEGEKRYELAYNEGESILQVLQNAGIESITAPCGGKGSCKKCSVFVQSREITGTCLSCTTPAKDNMLVELNPEVRISFADHIDAPVYAPDKGKTGYAVACDLGTTTIICVLLNMETGQQIAGMSGSNSQRIFGGDVLSRLKSAEEGHSEEIAKLIRNQLNYYIRELCSTAGISIDEVKMLSIAANTIMMHFVAGLNPAEISTSPFQPLSLFGEIKGSRELGFEFDGDVYLSPSVSSFIGGNVVCGILASGIAKAEKPELMLDLGTNTAIIVGDKNGLTACTADGGAAIKASLLAHGMAAASGAICGVNYEDGELKLEVLGGGKARGICGSGFIDLLGFMYENEILDDVGHIAAKDEVDEEFEKFICEEDGKVVFYLTDDRDIYISQEDISRFQLSKAAIYAGIEILTDELSLSKGKLERLYMCGGFGAFVKVRSAAILGMIPQECEEKAVKLGNVSLAGAISGALSEDARKEMLRIQKMVKVIDLPTHPGFNDIYTEGMFFEA